MSSIPDSSQSGSAVPLGATVRMYRLPGQGDCFLLSLPSSENRPFFVLVDFGVLLGTKRARDKLITIAEDIRATTSGVLDVVSLSKSHWDHVSGFHLAGNVFKNINIRQAWLSWQNDSQNLLARRISDRLPRYTQLLIPALRRILEEQSALGAEPQQMLREVSTFDEFLRYRPGRHTIEVIEQVKHMAQSTWYRGAGECLDLGPVRVYHLGPPLFTAEDGYLGMVSGLLGGMGLSEEKAMDYTLQLLALFPAPEKIPPQERNLLKRSRPFDWAEALPLSMVPQSEYQDFFGHHFGFADLPEHAPAWRRIAPDWVGPARFVLQQLRQLIAISNQAMAFELVESGKVLLFPGDSQESDWQLWESLKWKAGENETVVTCQDLLSRTVLYKVSHHGSRAGTPLQPGGLSWMTSPELVAMMPVHQEQAMKKRWQMPYPPLLDALIEKTHGRVLRMDSKMPERPESVSEEEWAQFERKVRFHPNDLWVEYEI